MERRLLRGRSNSRLLRTGLLLSNVVIFAAILLFVLENHTTSVSQQVSLNANDTTAASVANPLDQVSSAEIAQTVSQLSALPETVPITNQAESQAADIAIDSTDNSNVITKPQVVATALKSRADIEQYTTVAGDSLASLAAKFGVTSSSIAWSNHLTTDAVLSPGTSLTIPPVTGIVYTVKSGDTPASLATEFDANASQIIAFNDAEISGLTPGEQIVIPNGTETTAASETAGVDSSSFPWGSGPIYGYNGYDFGYCTWYVATQISVPSNWGNADTWAYYASLSGWNVSEAPTVGSIAQTDAGSEGHVAVVTAVLDGGTEIEWRDMNNYGDGGGWDKVGEGTGPTSTFEHFITH